MGSLTSYSFIDLMFGKTCQRCGACWFRNNETGELAHYWATGVKGKPGSERDLAGLVCNLIGDSECINPERGYTGPDQDTWEKRRKFIEGSYFGEGPENPTN